MRYVGHGFALYLDIKLVFHPGILTAAQRRHGSTGLLSLAQPQVPVHHRQLRGGEGQRMQWRQGFG